MSPSGGDGKVGIAVVPNSPDGIVEAVEAGGGKLVDPDEAQGIVWTEPRYPDQLAETLDASPATWVQLPFAGIEKFFDAGVIRPELTWTCAKGVYGPATAEHALALMLAGARRLHEYARADRWIHGRNSLESKEFRLSGKTVVIVGTGGIGRALAEMLVPLAPRIVGVNRSGTPLEEVDETVTVDGLDKVLPEAHVVVIAASLTPQTRGLIDRARLELMREDAWLINVARGGLVVTDDLVDALRNGSIGGAGLDVTDPEPLPDDHPLWTLDNVLITPHVANTWAMGLEALPGMVKRNVELFGAGEQLEGLVDPELGY